MNTIKVKYCREDLISRVPGLFPYLEFDENGVSHLHKSSDSDSGCYGKIVPSIRVPSDVTLVVDGQTLVSENTTYTYRTLIRLYYKYSHMTDSTFIQFFKTGIGRFVVFGYPDECDLVPEFEYYANAERLYNEYMRMKLAVTNYLRVKPVSGIDCEMECLVNKYNRMGGDYMLNFYAERFNESIHLSEIYYGYADVPATTYSVGINILATENDLGYLSTFIDKWAHENDYKAGNLVFYDNQIYSCVNDTNGGSGVWDPTIEEYVFDYSNFDLVTSQVAQNVNLNGTTNSVLKSFRGNKTYVDQNGSYPEPDDGEDWLWYYRIGDVPFYESTTDILGNIAMLDGMVRNTTVGDVDTGLMSYGNVLTDITVNTSEKLITFEYVIGAHLKATLAKVDTDSENNTVYYYNNFQYDNSDSFHGVKHTETYQYAAGGELDELLANNPTMFDQYIGRTEPNDSDMSTIINYGSHDISYKYLKCAFDTFSNVRGAIVNIDGSVENYRYIVSDYYVRVNSDADTVEAPTFKKDHLMGITYNPKVNVDVYIDRGNAASWERHIKLGEVKTFDDVENYANGGFFNLR